ncbi:MAG: VWA domain-containing protein [Lachnospiraceae bacterium]|nr:VWA domain-containing protein [Lachnospiraceae bacterium]
MKKKNTIIIVAVILVAVFAVTFAGIYMTRNLGKSKRVISEESAKGRLEKMVKEISPDTAQPVKSPIEYDLEEDAASELPEIDTCEVTAESTTPLYAEIYSSPEKAGTGTDGWLCEMANQFNSQGYKVDGQPVSVKVRKVNSGQALDYISTGKAVPDGFAPSNMLWVEMLRANNVNIEVLSESLTGNVAGILLTDETYKKMTEKYGTVDLKAITEATAAGEFAMGYTNPFASSAGMNFLICTLERYDSANPLSDTAVAGFRNFQQNVPFVALTTMQMREAAENGSLDGFILEYQSYKNDPALSREYKFTPFGYRHDNPLVSLGTTSDEKKQILEKFAEFCSSEEAQKSATEYGFNGMNDYVCEYADISGDILTDAQKLYKKNKDNGKPVVCIFVTDVSGSMEGEPIHALQNSLINSMKYINADNYIGMVSYSSYVTIELPVGKFDLNQQSLFKGAVENLSASGGTATFDAICVAMNMIQEAQAQTPDAKPMLFVLSDGDTNEGYTLNEIREVITGLKIPIYTIGYNANLDALKEISSVNEAASIDASTDDVVYQLKNLFNANM